MPSAGLVDHSAIFSSAQRRALLDKIAGLVDENLFGRSEMCMQFAELLYLALSHLRFPSRAILGTAIYYDGPRELFRWSHAWVRVGAEVIDGNVDSLFENPIVPASVKVPPYWGPIDQTPVDRKVRPAHGQTLQADSDVSAVWWPDLRAWIDGEFTAAHASKGPRS